jgi:hypothetical protein
VLAGPVLAGPVLAGLVLAGHVLAGPVLAGPMLVGSMLESDTVLSLDRPYGSPRRTMPEQCCGAAPRGPAGFPRSRPALSG